MLQNYIAKRALFGPLISHAPTKNLALVITIPAFNEKDLTPTLESISNSIWAKVYAVEVIILFNAGQHQSEDIKKQNRLTYEQSKLIIQQLESENLKFYCLIDNDLPKKKAGVGLARKVLMDEAIWRYLQIDKPSGIIACLDADTIVQPNYCQALLNYFNGNPSARAVGIYYEHDLSSSNSHGITLYELHLRYYVRALRKAGLITATQTVGSSMAVRANAYAAQGGMNTRQAGEDFYFLHKFTPHPGFAELTTTTTIPSARVSDRVPFGTGKAIGDILNSGHFNSYHPDIFSELTQILEKVDLYYSIDLMVLQSVIKTFPSTTQAFLKNHGFVENILRINDNTSSLTNFKHLFYQWFTPFFAMKFVHYLRDKKYGNLRVEKAAKNWLTKHSEWAIPETLNMDSPIQLLDYFRRKDRNYKSAIR